MAKGSRIIKVAGLSLVGFCAVSLVADKVAVSPETSQLAGYCGAVLGALVGRGRSLVRRVPETPQNSPVSNVPEAGVLPADHG
jgi:hypothetical protein